MYALGRWIKYAKRDKERGQRAKKPKEGKRKTKGRQKEDKRNGAEIGES
jgi:hypothetical protein